MPNQAAFLDREFQKPKYGRSSKEQLATCTNKSIAFTSGKGGVGKTNSCVNIAIALVKTGKKVLLLDADFGLANIDIMLKIRPRFTVESMLEKNVPLPEVLCGLPDPDLKGLRVLCSSSGIPEMTAVESEKMRFIIGQLAKAQKFFDYLIIDTGAGISQNVLRFNASVSEMIVVTTPEPTALSDAYTLMKVMFVKHGKEKFSLIVNQAKPQESLQVREAILKVVKSNGLDLKVDLLGNITRDDKLVEAVKRREAVVNFAPHSKSARDCIDIAGKIASSASPFPSSPSGSGLWQRFFEWSKSRKRQH